MTARPWHGGELRWNAETEDWTVLAPSRGSRPHSAAGAACPFCPGPAEDTPPETWRLPGGDVGWRVRAVPNRYALSDRHEIVIESPRHDWDLATGTDGEVADVLGAWQHRHRALRPATAQVVVFRNHGLAAGISLAHPHSQIAGLPVLSAETRRELETARVHHRDRGRLLAGEQLEAALSDGKRIVFADDHVVAYTPFAPIAAYEVRILPHRAGPDFAAAGAEEIRATARCLRTILAALRAELGDPAYNVVVRTAPTGYETAPFLAWSLQLVPRLETPAGLELATGVPVTTVSPEHAAARLRTLVGMADVG
ncbi:galactose-1-phosphate uridylyltransferase [Amycolatopsis mongoliensis]|uniref:Galactose-1-phosphate uridylyltransferase n=1 Tax=Amycolatopsis mongoliensis TaxID=715475 RepID=A0A9Y2NI49_9PSEU|nr:galactose-1-phosphate uridylyltransferase [Amycolatopsis sp. 4-36]WIY00378.1 galactose-1-phosphate uridylyltransferase [Amycolatopsis sp. 4-36]